MRSNLPDEDKARIVAEIGVITPSGGVFQGGPEFNREFLELKKSLQCMDNHLTSK